MKNIFLYLKESIIHLFKEKSWFIRFKDWTKHRKLLKELVALLDIYPRDVRMFIRRNIKSLNARNLQQIQSAKGCKYSEILECFGILD